MATDWSPQLQYGRRREELCRLMIKSTVVAVDIDGTSVDVQAFPFTSTSRHVFIRLIFFLKVSPLTLGGVKKFRLDSNCTKFFLIKVGGGTVRKKPSENPIKRLG
jgi:hypothetical protein